MKLFEYELKKIFIYRFGAVIVLLFLLAELALIFAGDTPANQNALTYREQYLTYLEQVVGLYTEEKAAWLEAESDAITEAKQTQDDLYQQFYSGTISETELQEQLQPCEETLRNEKGFDVIYDQYLYICEGTENRCFVEVNGWSGLLGSTLPDVPLLFALLLLIVPIFCGEYSCGMDALALTTRNGRRSYLRDKLLAALVVTVLLCGTEMLLRWSYFALRYGLANGECGMQSIELLGGSKKSLTLTQAFWFLSLCRWFGAIYLSLLAMAVAALCRRYNLTMLSALALVLLPWLGLSEGAQYRLPLPLPFLLGVGFLKGSETADTYDPTATVFQALSGSEIALLWAVSLGVSLLCVAILHWKHRNAFAKGKFRKRAAGLMAVLVLVSSLTGCGATGSDETEAVYHDTHTPDSYYTSDYRLWYDYDNYVIMAEDLETGKNFSVLRDPLNAAKSMEMGDYFYVEGDDLYCTAVTEESYNEQQVSSVEVVTTFTLYRVNLLTFESTVLYEHSSSTSFLGVSLTGSDTLSNLLWDTMPFFLRGNKLYLAEESDGVVYEINIRTDRVRLLPFSFQSSTVAYDGQRFFYINDHYALCAYDLSMGAVTERTEVAVHDLCLVGDTLYYSDLRENYKLYAVPTDSGDAELVSELEVMGVRWNGKALVLTYSPDNTGNGFTMEETELAVEP